MDGAIDERDLAPIALAPELTEDYTPSLMRDMGILERYVQES